MVSIRSSRKKIDLKVPKMPEVGFSRDLRLLSNSEFLAFPKILLGRVGKALISSESSCYALTLTPNHLLLRTGELPMATVMRRPGRLCPNL